MRYNRKGQPLAIPNEDSWIAIEQIRAARALVGWTQAQAAEACNIPLDSWRNMEKRRGRRRLQMYTMRKVVAGFEAKGVRFTANGVERIEDTFARDYYAATGAEPGTPPYFYRLALARRQLRQSLSSGL